MFRVEVETIILYIASPDGHHLVNGKLWNAGTIVGCPTVNSYYPCIFSFILRVCDFQRRTWIEIPAPVEMLHPFARFSPAVLHRTVTSIRTLAVGGRTVFGIEDHAKHRVTSSPNLSGPSYYSSDHFESADVVILSNPSKSLIMKFHGSSDSDVNISILARRALRPPKSRPGCLQAPCRLSCADGLYSNQDGKNSTRRC
jgi:hypothetical protein